MAQTLKLSEDCFKDISADTTEQGRFYETPKGDYPSITTVLSHLSKPSLEKWRARVGEAEADRISKDASIRGEAVHDLLEKHYRGENPSLDGLGIDVVHPFHTVRRHLDSRLDEIYAQEVCLYSDYLGVAGRVDMIAKYEGKLAIIDFKTSKKFKRKEWIKNYFMQESAYAVCVEELTGIPITKLVTVIGVDGMATAQHFEEHRNDHIKDFIEAKDEWYRQNRALIEARNS